MTARFERAAWVGYAIIFLAIPLAVLVFRLHMQAWHYYLAGGLFLAGALVCCAIDMVALGRRDAAERAQRRAAEGAARTAGSS